MNNLKQIPLITVLNTLSNKEKKGLLQFVDSSFFNGNDNVRKLLIALVYGEIPLTHFPKKTYFELLFPDLQLTQQNIYDLTSFTYRLLEEFLIQLSLKEEQGVKAPFLLKQLRNRRLNPIFLKTQRKIEAAHHKISFRNDEYYKQQFLNSTEIDLFQVETNPRSAFASLQHKADTLDAFYIISKLKTTCEMINRSNIIHTNYKLNFIKPIEAYIDASPELLVDVPAIKVYRTVLKTLTEPQNENHFVELKKLISTHLHLFPKEEGKGLYHYAQNYCIKQLNKGITSYLNEVFLLYKEQINNGYIFNHEELTEWDYKNIITVGLRLKEYTWTEQFIFSFKQYLPKAIQENAYNYNQANFYAETGDWKEAVRLLQDVRFTDVSYNLSARILLVKIFYEQEEEEILIDQIKAFRNFLSRNKSISDYQCTIHKNLLKGVSKLVALKSNRPQKKTGIFLKKHAHLQQKMEENQDIANKKWLLQKLEEINFTVS